MDYSQAVEYILSFTDWERASAQAFAAANFDLRRSICRIPQGQLEMIERARRAGATAKFAGSGGAIIGTYPDDDVYRRLVTDLAPIECDVFRPIVE